MNNVRNMMLTVLNEPSHFNSMSLLRYLDRNKSCYLEYDEYIKNYPSIARSELDIYFEYDNRQVIMISQFDRLDMYIRLDNINKCVHIATKQKLDVISYKDNQIFEDFVTALEKSL